MSRVELRRVVGEFTDRRTGKKRRVGWDMDLLLLDGKQIATINRVPGAPVGLMAGVELSPSQIKAVEAAVAESRGGVKPCKIVTPVKLPYEVLDDEPEIEEYDEIDEEPTVGWSARYVEEDDE